MAQTVAVVRATLPFTSVGETVDFTKASFGTPTAAIIISCAGNATTNPTPGAEISVGFWDGTNARGLGVRAQDNVADSNAGRSSDNSYGVVVPNESGAAVLAAYSVSSITDGIRLTLAVDNTGVGRFCTVILLAGVSAVAGTLTTNTTQDATAASGSLGFAPKLVLFTTIGATAADTNAVAAEISFGFARDDGTHRMVAFTSPDAQAAELANILYSETRCVGQVLADATTWTGEVTTFGVDTFTMTTRDGSSGADVCFFLALGGADLSFDVGTLTTTTDAANDIVVATDVAPDAVLTMLSTATGTTLETGSGANGIAIGLADDNGQFSHNLSVEDGATTINANSAAQAAALIDLDTISGGTRADMIDGVVTLNSGDFTINPSVTDGTARKGWWVAFGAAVGGGTTVARHMLQHGLYASYGRAA